MILEPRVTIWLFSDGRRGHEKQTIGLVRAIEASLQQGVELCRIAVGTSIKKLSELPKPSLILGSGNATHLPMLLSKLLFNAPCVVLMKPSLPTSFFDLAFVPHHDRCSNFGNVHTTIGVLCPVPDVRPNANHGVILLGGSSRHYHWDSDLVESVVSNICVVNPKKRWTICDSPRSPANLLARFSKLSNATTRHWHTTNESFVTELLNTSSETWVTCDSVTMLYEALNTGAPVGIIELRSRKRFNKLARGINNLANNGHVHMVRSGYLIGSELAKWKPGQEIRQCADLCRHLINNASES